MSVPIQPLADYVVAQVEKAETKTASGLYLPDKVQEKPKIAKVVAVGKEAKQVTVGDRILYKSYGPTDVKVGNEDFIPLTDATIHNVARSTPPWERDVVIVNRNHLVAMYLAQ